MKYTDKLIPLEHLSTNPRNTRLPIYETFDHIWDADIERGVLRNPLIVIANGDNNFQAEQGTCRIRMFQWMEHNRSDLFEKYYAKGIRCKVLSEYTPLDLVMLECDQEESQGLSKRSEICLAVIKMLEVGLKERDILGKLFLAFQRHYHPNPLIASEYRAKMVQAAQTTDPTRRKEIEFEATKSLVAPFHATWQHFQRFYDLPAFVFECWRSLESRVGDKSMVTVHYPNWVPIDLQSVVPDVSGRITMQNLEKAFNEDLKIIGASGKQCFDRDNCGPNFQKTWLAFMSSPVTTITAPKRKSLRDVKSDTKKSRSSGVKQVVDYLEGREDSKALEAIDNKLYCAEWIFSSPITIHEAIDRLTKDGDDDPCELKAHLFFIRLANMLAEDEKLVALKKS